MAPRFRMAPPAIIWMAQTASLHLMSSLRMGQTMCEKLGPFTKPWHQYERPLARIGACLCVDFVQHLKAPGFCSVKYSIEVPQ